MTNVVGSSAMLQCSFGAAPSTLTVLPDKRVTVDKMPAANIMDSKPNVNIAPFGMCSAPTNPVVISATAAAQGVFTPQPCIPAIAGPWVPGAIRTSIAKQPALTKSSVCNCTWLGVVTVQQPGTSTTTAT